MRIKRGHYVYLLKCSDGTYYAGYTVDLHNRLRTHNSGKGAKYVRGRTPAVIVYSKKFRARGEALKAEAAIKKLSRSRKKQLAGGRRFS